MRIVFFNRCMGIAEFQHFIFYVSIFLTRQAKNTAVNRNATVSPVQIPKSVAPIITPVSGRQYSCYCFLRLCLLRIRHRLKPGLYHPGFDTVSDEFFLLLLRTV